MQSLFPLFNYLSLSTQFVSSPSFHFCHKDDLLSEQEREREGWGVRERASEVSKSGARTVHFSLPKLCARAYKFAQVFSLSRYAATQLSQWRPWRPVRHALA